MPFHSKKQAFRLFLSPILVLVLTLAASAEMFTIAAFDDTRSNRRFMGTTTTASRGAFVGADWYSSVRENWLTVPGAFDSATVQLLSTEVDDARTFDFAAHQVDLLIMSEVNELSDEAAAMAEADRIAQFVRDGGCLVIVADTLDNWRGDTMGNRVLAALDGGSGEAGRFGASIFSGSQSNSAGRLFEEAGWVSNVLNGPFAFTSSGTSAGDPVALDLETARLGATYHLAVTPHSDPLEAWSHVIAQRQDGCCTWRNLAMEIQGSDIGPGAGNVLIVGDTLFTNEFVFPLEAPFAQSRQNWNNARLLMNFVDQQVTSAPEPGIMALAAGALGLMALAARRRKRSA
ncbi:MAG: PEP-CTERM sorting domain-containing protein [Pirellulales bacterium]|nr:PEP-CTERM sorting domain-containing protein [Pirellulales bacterium]